MPRVSPNYQMTTRDTLFLTIEQMLRNYQEKMFGSYLPNNLCKAKWIIKITRAVI